jgi:hypothetical protein
VVLLHDAGGDRSRTVAALPELIDQIRAHGYRLVTIGELAGMTPQQVMPPTSRNGRRPGLDRLGFDFFRWAQTAMVALFITAIFLGVARLVFLAEPRWSTASGRTRSRPIWTARTDRWSAC